jgi:hypothetical protein
MAGYVIYQGGQGAFTRRISAAHRDILHDTDPYGRPITQDVGVIDNHYAQCQGDPLLLISGQSLRECIAQLTCSMIYSTPASVRKNMILHVLDVCFPSISFIILRCWLYPG